MLVTRPGRCAPRSFHGRAERKCRKGVKVGPMRHRFSNSDLPLPAFLEGRVDMVRRASPRRAVCASSSSDSEAQSLRDENHNLRRELLERLSLLDKSKRDEILARHRLLVEAARDAGETIPPLDALMQNEMERMVHKEGNGVDEEETIQNSKQVEENAVNPQEDTSSSQGTEAVYDEETRESELIEVDGVPVVIEADRDDTLVFKFGGVSNRVRSSQMSVNRESADSDAVLYHFGSDDDALDAVSAKTNKPGKGSDSSKAIAANEPRSLGDEDPRGSATAASDSENEDSDSEGLTGNGGKKRGSTKRNKTSSKRRNAPSATTVDDPYASIKQAANDKANNHDPAEELAGKEHWLYLTVPNTPVAGASCLLYYNRARSEYLKSRPHLELMLGFNDWELRPAEDEDRAVFAPVQGGPPVDDGTDFWCVPIRVPEDAYELQFVVGDGEGTFDNNFGKNYHLEVQGKMSRDLWADTAADRAEAAYLARQEAERIAAEKEAAAREEAALDADLEKARGLIQEIKERRGEWLDGAVDPSDGLPLWRVVARSSGSKEIRPGDKVRIQYNRLAGPLHWLDIPDHESLVVRVGHNGWKGSQDLRMSRVTKKTWIPKSEGDVEWWEAELEVPETSVALNFVFNYYEHFDNNNACDFNVRVSLAKGFKSSDDWADSLVDRVWKALTAERREMEAAERAREEAKKAEREAARAKALEVRRRQMRHMMYTEPAVPVAGQKVTIHYNPNNTILHGSQSIYIKGGFNRWHHRIQYGPLGLEADGSSKEAEHWTITLDVPKDAFSLDFVFTDSPNDDGRFDNRGGLDYHIPVENSVVRETPMYVVHIAVEMAPICKVGGLGDVVTALGRAVQNAGHLVEVILPRYDFFLSSPLLGGTRYETEFEWAGTKIFVSSCIVEGLRCWFIEPANGMFSGDAVYRGGTQDPGRFAFFSRAALEFLLRTQRQPDILHCHDWSTAEVARAYWTEYHDFGLWKPNVIFTIHNLNYGAQAIGEAAHHCQRFTTVSPTYAWEIGGTPAVAPHVGKLMGIRNGIDVDIWNPEEDQFLPREYSADNCEEGKAAARAELRMRLGLTGWGDKPIVAVVSRLTKQKGTHLIAHAAWKTIDRGGQFILLGSAPDPKIQAEFDGLAAQCGGENAAFCFAFDEPLSHLIYAAADIVVVPSMFEPCGLTQMIAMRYGAIPVVRHTGGLRDTVFDVDHDQGRAAWELEGSTDWQADGIEATNGFAFEGTDPGALDYALNRAMDAFYNDKEWFRGLQQRVMRQDWSWNKPGVDYVELYHAAMK